MAMAMKLEEVCDGGSSASSSAAEEDTLTDEGSGSGSGSGNGSGSDSGSDSDNNSNSDSDSGGGGGSDNDKDSGSGVGSVSHDDDGSSSSDDEPEEDAGNRDAGESAAQGEGVAPAAALTAAGDEVCTFDLAHLVAHNTHQVNAAALYQPAAAGAADAAWYARPPTMPPPVGAPAAREAALLARAAAGATQLLRELWRLPVAQKTDAGPLVRLPNAAGGIRLPRALPPPPPKQPTKWEKFALQRGIAPKSKNSRKVYDEASGEWKHLTGSLANKANAGPESWPIIEVKKNDDPMADPWEKLREEKQSRVSKNAEARTKNAERAGVLERGSAGRLARGNRKREQQSARARERERGLAAPAGVPLDLSPMGGDGPTRRGRPSTQLALRATQVSTASLGKFDRQREGEPERKPLSKSIHGSKKRKQQQLVEGSGCGASSTNKKLLQREAQKSADILQTVMSGSSSKERERDVKKGKYAKGETAYDYEFNDGLGSGSFKKKKGRAGMGKMKKITKKRIK